MWSLNVQGVAGELCSEYCLILINLNVDNRTLTIIIIHVSHQACSESRNRSSESAKENGD